MSTPVDSGQEHMAIVAQVRRYASRFSVTAFGQGVSFAVGLGTQVVLARALRVEAYGQYALVSASASLLVWFVGFGLNIATPALVRGDPARARTVAGLAGAYLTVLAVVAAAAF